MSAPPLLATFSSLAHKTVVLKLRGVNRRVKADNGHRAVSQRLLLADLQHTDWFQDLVMNKLHDALNQSIFTAQLKLGGLAVRCCMGHELQFQNSGDVTGKDWNTGLFHWSSTFCATIIV